MGHDPVVTHATDLLNLIGPYAGPVWAAYERKGTRWELCTLDYRDLANLAVHLSWKGCKFEDGRSYGAIVNEFQPGPMPDIEAVTWTLGTRRFRIVRFDSTDDFLKARETRYTSNL